MHGKSDSRRDHLVSWDICCKPKKQGGLVIGNLVLKIYALVAKWLWRFPLETTSLRHRVIKSMVVKIACYLLRLGNLTFLRGPNEFDSTEKLHSVRSH